MHQQVEPLWLKNHLEDEQIRVIDCRFRLGNPEEGRDNYVQGHIPGAVFFDLEKDLSGPVEKHGGRHPLPDVTILKARLEDAGINNDHTLIVYDAHEGAFASRFWWLLKYIGHEKVFILAGGFNAWREAGFPVEQKVKQFPISKFSIAERIEMLASYEEVKNIVQNDSGDTVLIDSREAKRYLGLEEPIDRIAGHIPTAINKPWMDGLVNGRFKPKAEQEERFAGISKDQSLIVYCGSGVTATPNIIALKEAGYKNVRLYAGSYSDWVSYEGNRVEKGNKGR